MTSNRICIDNVFLLPLRSCFCHFCCNCIEKPCILTFRCDADPSALANYVVALVKKDKSEKELRALCADQLDVFLQKGKISFCYIHPTDNRLSFRNPV